MRILITGASGTGTTTLGRAIANRLDFAFLDADDYFWLPTSPPFQEKRDAETRRILLLKDLEAVDNGVVSGSIAGWGGIIEDSFSLIVFLRLDTAIRLQRLRSREEGLLGNADPAFLGMGRSIR